MTTPTLPTRRHAHRPVERWTPPLPPDGLARIAERLREVTPLDEVVDDIGDVLDEVCLAPERFEAVARRVRGGLTRLVRIAVAGNTDADAETAALIRRARALRSEPLPVEHDLALGHLRRMAGAALCLLERLVAIGAMREVA
ncbi:DUF6415 family natural product biosynthesis protein [Streptomyces sp. NPDC001142]